LAAVAGAKPHDAARLGSLSSRLPPVQPRHRAGAGRTIATHLQVEAAALPIGVHPIGELGEVLGVRAAALLDAATPACVEIALTRNGKAFACSDAHAALRRFK